MDCDGALFAVGGVKSNQIELSALMSSVWTSLSDSVANVSASSSASDDNPEPTPQHLLVDCSNGRVAITKVGPLLLCLSSDRSVLMGMLRQRLLGLAKQLSQLEQM